MTLAPHPDPAVEARLSRMSCRTSLADVDAHVQNVWSLLEAHERADVAERLSMGHDAYEIFEPSGLDNNFHDSRNLLFSLYLGSVEAERKFELIYLHLQRDTGGVTILEHLCNRLLAEHGHATLTLGESDYNASALSPAYRNYTRRVLVARAVG